MKRRDFLHTVGAAAAGGMLVRAPLGLTKKLDRIGLETYAVRHAMAQDPERTLAAIRTIGYTDVELLWSFNLFGRTPQQVAATLRTRGCARRRATCPPTRSSWAGSAASKRRRSSDISTCSCPISKTGQTDAGRLAGMGRSLQRGRRRRAEGGIWLGFHNEAYHQKPIDGQVPFDVFINRLDPSVTRLQLDVGNMLIGGGDPMQYLQKYPDRFWSFHLKDAVADRSRDTGLGKGIFDFKRFLAAVPMLEQKPAHVEQESASDAAGDLATRAAISNTCTHWSSDGRPPLVFDRHVRSDPSLHGVSSPCTAASRCAQALHVCDRARRLGRGLGLAGDRFHAHAPGHTVVRVTLTGLGERHHLASPNIGLDTHIDDVVNKILWDNLRDVVLVGHSYGGW